MAAQAPKITFFCDHIYPLVAGVEDPEKMGGAEVQQYLLAQHLQKLGWRVGFVLQGPHGNHHHTVDGFEIHSYALPTPGGHRRWRQIRKWAAIFRAVWAANSHILYISGVHYLIAVAWLVTRLRGGAYIMAVNSNLTVYPYPVFHMGRRDRRLYRRILHGAARIVVQTEFQAQMLVRHYGVNPDKQVVIRDGALATPRVDSARHEPPTVVWLATMHRYKGVEAVFELARLHPGLHFVVGGGPAIGEAAYYAEMEEQAARLENVEWRGFVRRAEINEFMQGALAFINTTVARPELPNLEGFPNVYLEAWRNHVPTLTLHNDPDGLIVAHELGFASGSVEQMAADLQRLVDDSDLRRQMGENARRHFEAHHDIAQTAQRLATLCHTVLQ